MWNRDTHYIHQDRRYQLDQVAGRVDSFCSSVLASRLALLGVLLVEDKVLHRKGLEPCGLRSDLQMEGECSEWCSVAEVRLAGYSPP